MFRERLLAGELLVGCFLNTASPVAAEICAGAGFDWLLFDLEHGSATEAHLLPQLQALDGFLDARVLVRALGDEHEVVVTTTWESLDAVKRFAGDDYEVAVVEGLPGGSR